jgi:hypothetical protein
VLFALGCQGQVGDTPGPGVDPFDPPPGYCASAPAMLGRVPVRRLSRVEYMNTVDDLLFGVARSAPDIPEDATEGGFENASRHLSAPALLVERYELTASQAAEAAMADAGTRTRVLGCTSWTTAAEQDACAESFLDEFGKRAFRRPLTAEERAAFLAFIDEKTTAIDFEAAIELAIAALMQSAQFSYRVEVGEGGALSPYEMASRLSYFLWQNMPDDELFAAAAAGELASPAQLEAQARRMMEEPRARLALIDFHRQWLDFDRVIDEPKDPTLFPDWTPALREAIREEADRFVGGVMFDGEGTISALLTSNRSWVNGPLAEHYGLDPVSDWTEVTLPAGERSGILTRSDFLAGHAHETNGSPVLRGVFVIDRLLCGGLGAPPAGADTSTPEPDPSMGPVTNRMLFEERTEPAQCQACHVRINGIGFGFENYDSTGRYRTEDNTLPVDATGEIVGTDVDGPYDGGIELSAELAASRAVSDCVAHSWVRYAIGRRAVSEDACLIELAETSLVEHGGDMRELLVDIVTSPDFARGLQ